MDLYRGNETLIHYTDRPIENLENINYNFRKHELDCKPEGFWVSVENGWGWGEWCSEQGNFRSERRAYVHQITLKKQHSVLHLSSQQEVLEFTEKYYQIPFHYNVCFPTLRYTQEKYTLYIDWTVVKQVYQGLIVSPYFKELATPESFDTMWYWSWHCSSGCIWDLSCIEEFKLIKGLPNLVRQEACP